MKKLIYIIIFTLAALPMLAQEEEQTQQHEHDPKVKERIQAARIAYITDQLGLTPEEAEKFWPIYREFSEKRQNLQKQYREMKRNPDPNKTTEENEKDLVDVGFKLKQQELDLEKDYSGRLLKVISAQKLRSLPEAEKRFRQMILEQIQRRQFQQERKDQLKDRSQQKLQQRNN